MCTQKLKRMMIDSGVWGTFWQSHGRSNFPIRTHHVFVMFTCALTKQNHWIIGVTQGRWTVSSAICSPFSRSFTIGFPHLFVARWSWSRTLLGYPEEKLHIGKWACASSVPCKLLSLSHGVSSLGVQFLHNLPWSTVSFSISQINPPSHIRWKLIYIYIHMDMKRRGTCDYTRTTASWLYMCDPLRLGTRSH